MSNKEEKFFEQLRLFCLESSRSGIIFSKISTGEIDLEEGREMIADIKKKLRPERISLLEKIYKLYKSPVEIDFAKNFVYQIYNIINLMNETVLHISVFPADKTPKEFMMMTQLIQSALEEILKTLEYAPDISENYMKIEARYRKVHVFEERGDVIYKDALRELFAEGKKPEYIICWKEIFADTEKMLDAAAESVSSLQRLLTNE